MLSTYKLIFAVCRSVWYFLNSEACTNNCINTYRIFKKSSWEKKALARSQVLPFKAVHAKYQMSDRDTVGTERI